MQTPIFCLKTMSYQGSAPVNPIFHRVTIRLVHGEVDHANDQTTAPGYRHSSNYHLPVTHSNFENHDYPMSYPTRPTAILPVKLAPHDPTALDSPQLVAVGLSHPIDASCALLKCIAESSHLRLACHHVDIDHQSIRCSLIG